MRFSHHHGWFRHSFMALGRFIYLLTPSSTYPPGPLFGETVYDRPRAVELAWKAACHPTPEDRDLFRGEAPRRPKTVPSSTTEQLMIKTGLEVSSELIQEQLVKQSTNLLRSDGKRMGGWHWI